MLATIALILGWWLDHKLGDPADWPHPVVWFGRIISIGEHRLNRGRYRCCKGGIMAALLVLATYVTCALVGKTLGSLNGFWGYFAGGVFQVLVVFYCLAGTTLLREVKAVFLAIDKSLEAGRAQVARIVGRDTAHLSANEVRLAALETLAENLSDGVIAPLFWWLVLGVPGMLAYKMANTLDSMIGYRTARYREFGCMAARIDDVLNWLPARLTALLMLLVVPGHRHVCGRFKARLAFVWHYGRCHLSPNSGYPEAALAALLGCRFGGGHFYFDEWVSKPYIGKHMRAVKQQDLPLALMVNSRSETCMIILVGLFHLFLTSW